MTTSRSIRSVLSLGLGAALAVGLLAFAPAPALAAPAAGTSCAKVGATATVAWTQLACRRTAKGKVWRVTARGPVYSLAEGQTVVDCAADPTAALVDSATARLYYVTSGEGPCRAAEATAPDSLVVPVVGGAAVPDTGRRFSLFDGPAGPHKRVMTLPGGGYRMFFSTRIGAQPVGIGSATSPDGLTFVEDPGLRISVEAAGVGDRPALSPGDVVPVGGGRYRMYFSSFKFGPRNPMTETEVVKSAVSSDLLTWTVERGVRIGAGARLTGSGEHPSAVRHPDGGVTLFYGRPTNQYALYYSWSPDGLTFSREVALVPRVLDSAFIRLPDGRLSGFIGRRDDSAERSYIDRVQLTPRR
jgi:hypothetical protein